MSENRTATVEVNRFSRGHLSGWVTLPPTNVWARGIWWQLNINPNPEQRITITDPGAPPTIPPSTTEYRVARCCPECCRVGGGRRAPYWAHRWHVDFWFRSWQSECPEMCRCARRAWTPAGARRKMARDAWLADRGITSFHQARKAQAAGRYRTAPDGYLVEVLPPRVWGRRR